MKNNIEQLLLNNLKYFENLLHIVTEQKELIAKKNFSDFNKKDVIKHNILIKILENNQSLEVSIFRNKKNNNIVQDTVKKINLLLEKIINIEKDNAGYLADLNLMISGEYIESYKKIIK